jgi:hypothetical protein
MSTGTMWNDDVLITILGDINDEDSDNFKAKYYAEGAGTALNHKDAQNQDYKITLTGSTSDGEAHAFDDYTAVTNDLTQINASASQSNPFVLESFDVENDSEVEGLEDFTYNVGVSSAHTIAPEIEVRFSSPMAAITILDDDGA